MITPVLNSFAAVPSAPIVGGAVPPAVSVPQDQVTIQSPFHAVAVAPNPLASLPVARENISHESGASHDRLHTAVLAALGGLSVMGSLGLVGCTTTPAIAAPVQSEAANTQQTGAANPFLRAASAAPSMHFSQAAPQPAAQTRVTVFGQDVNTDSAPTGVTWATYQGSYEGQGYSVDYPQGWKVAKLFNGVAVVNPSNPEEFTAFQWDQGTGNLSPRDLLNQVLAQSGATDVHVDSEQDSPPRQTPNGPILSGRFGVSYTADGVPVRGTYVTAVTNSNMYTPYYVGSVVAMQSPAQDFAQNQPVLEHISNSMTSQ